MSAAASSALLLPGSFSPRIAGRRFGAILPSPRLTPFLTPLPIPAALRSVAPFVPVGTSAPPQAPLAAVYHQIVAEQRFVSMHPQLPPTMVWGYRDASVSSSASALGPTMLTRADQPFFLRVTNALPVDHIGFGSTHLSTHFHGGHVEARSDGFPENVNGNQSVIGPGESYDYCYGMMDPGYLHAAEDPGERPSTLWYHDHVLDFTAQNVMRGLAGLAIYRDALDTGDETTGLGLPGGAYDIPLVLQDRRFDAAGQLVYDPLDHNGFLGDTFLVNGVVQPYLVVDARKYRIRLLDACNARFLNLRFVRDNGQVVPFDLIATEGGLTSRPLRGRTDILLSPAQRQEVVVDFAPFPPGTVLYLENNLDQLDGRGPIGTLERPGLKAVPDRFLKIVVGQRVADPSRVPDVLRPFAPIGADQLARAARQSFEFNRRNGVWTINGLAVDLTKPICQVRLNQPNVWTLRNNAGGWWHPVHIHLEYFRVISRNGRLPEETERDGIAKRDMITLGPNDAVEVYVNFRDYPGRWVMHCHTVEHEDAFMMACFEVLP